MRSPSRGRNSRSYGSSFNRTNSRARSSDLRRLIGPGGGTSRRDVSLSRDLSHTQSESSSPPHPIPRESTLEGADGQIVTNVDREKNSSANMSEKSLHRIENGARGSNGSRTTGYSSISQRVSPTRVNDTGHWIHGPAERRRTDMDTTSSSGNDKRIMELEEEIHLARKANARLMDQVESSQRETKTAKQYSERMRQSVDRMNKKYADLKKDYNYLRDKEKDRRREKEKDGDFALKDQPREHPSVEVDELNPCLYCLRPLPVGFVSHVESHLEYELKAVIPQPQPRQTRNTDGSRGGLIAESGVNETAGKDLGTEAPLTVDDIEKIAMQATGVVFDEASGMYYDFSTGYYYHSESGLYFEPNTQTYYHLDQSTNTYVYHSSAEQYDQTSATPNAQSSVPEDIICVRLIINASPAIAVNTIFCIGVEGGTVGREMDAGHLLQIDDEDMSREHAEIHTWSSSNARERQLQQQWKQVDSAEAVVTPFWIRDLGSRNGTYVNDQKIPVIDTSDTICDKEENVNNRNCSLPKRTGTRPYRHAIRHGDEIRMGATKVLVHAHPGHSCCDKCAQPFETPDASANKHTLASGGVDNSWTSIAAAPVVQSVSVGEGGGVIDELIDIKGFNADKRSRKEAERHRVMEVQKRKFGLDAVSKAEINVTKPDEGSYVDRAAQRRKDNPNGDWTDTWDPTAPVKSSSVSKPIESSNKGFKMLNKMGWSGGGLGKEGNKGITEPVVQSTQGKGLGLGSQHSETTARMHKRIRK
eukprot:CFRG2214T1